MFQAQCVYNLDQILGKGKLQLDFQDAQIWGSGQY